MIYYARDVLHSIFIASESTTEQIHIKMWHSLTSKGHRIGKICYTVLHRKYISMQTELTEHIAWHASIIWSAFDYKNINSHFTIQSRHQFFH